MEKIRRFLYDNNRKSPVLVPRVLPNLVTRYLFLYQHSGYLILNNVEGSLGCPVSLIKNDGSRLFDRLSFHSKILLFSVL